MPGDSRFDILRVPQAVAVRVHGVLDVSLATRLGAVLDDLIEGQGNARVDLDLGHVDHIDPAGLGVFAVAASVARLRGSELRVVGSPPQTSSLAGSVVAGDHLVDFYETDATLARSVGDFLLPALRTDDPVLVVATPGHREAVERALAGAGMDVGAARAAGSYLDVDAEETLALVMAGDEPDGGRFDQVVRGLMRRVAVPGHAPRIYGEMVSILWAGGSTRAAVALEGLWNRLRRSQRFALLCGYPRASFDVVRPGGSLRAVCECHMAA